MAQKVPGEHQCALLVYAGREVTSSWTAQAEIAAVVTRIAGAALTSQHGMIALSNNLVELIVHFPQGDIAVATLVIDSHIHMRPIFWVCRLRFHADEQPNIAVVQLIAIADCPFQRRKDAEVERFGMANQAVEAQKHSLAIELIAYRETPAFILKPPEATEVIETAIEEHEPA